MSHPAVAPLIEGRWPIPVPGPLRDPEGLRAWLHTARGVVATSGRSDRCPLARYLRAVGAGDWAVCSYVAVLGTMYCDLPAWATAFVRRIDDTYGVGNAVTAEGALTTLDAVAPAVIEAPARELAGAGA